MKGFLQSILQEIMYAKKNLEHQTLGRRFICPIIPATQRIILEIDGFLFRSCTKMCNKWGHSWKRWTSQEVWRKNCRLHFQLLCINYPPLAGIWVIINLWSKWRWKRWRQGRTKWRNLILSKFHLTGHQKSRLPTWLDHFGWVQAAR